MTCSGGKGVSQWVRTLVSTVDDLGLPDRQVVKSK